LWAHLKTASDKRKMEVKFKMSRKLKAQVGMDEILAYEPVASVGF
jgi:hypothetical protein